MSLCHIWHGVLRSKKRGFAGLRRTLLGAAGISCFACNVRRTVSALAGTKNSRLSTCEMRFTPKSGFARLTSTIFDWTAVNAPLTWRRCTAPYPGCSPASPFSRYCLTQSNTVPLVTPTSCATSPDGTRSSRYSFTALRRCSNVAHPA
jgi:hypothetical protein